MAMFNSFLYVYQRLNPKNLPVRFPLSSAASQAVAAEEVIATGQLETVLRPQTGHLRLGWGNIEVKLPMPMAMQREPIDWRNLPYIRPI